MDAPKRWKVTNCGNAAHGPKSLCHKVMDADGVLLLWDVDLATAERFASVQRLEEENAALRAGRTVTQSEWEAMTAEVHALKADNEERAWAVRTLVSAVAGLRSGQPCAWLGAEWPRIRRVHDTEHPGAYLLSEMADLRSGVGSERARADAAEDARRDALSDSARLRRELAETKREAAENADALAQAQAELQAATIEREAMRARVVELEELLTARPEHLTSRLDAAQQRVRELEARHAAGVSRARARYDVLDSLVRRTDPYDDGPCWCEHRRSHAEALHNRACRDARASMAWTGVDMEAAS